MMEITADSYTNCKYYNEALLVIMITVKVYSKMTNYNFTFLKYEFQNTQRSNYFKINIKYKLILNNFIGKSRTF